MPRPQGRSTSPVDGSIRLSRPPVAWVGTAHLSRAPCRVDKTAYSRRPRKISPASQTACAVKTTAPTTAGMPRTTNTQDTAAATTQTGSSHLARAACCRRDFGGHRRSTGPSTVSSSLSTSERARVCCNSAWRAGTCPYAAVRPPTSVRGSGHETRSRLCPRLHRGWGGLWGHHDLRRHAPGGPRVEGHACLHGCTWTAATIVIEIIWKRRQRP